MDFYPDSSQWKKFFSRYQLQIVLVLCLLYILPYFSAFAQVIPLELNDYRTIASGDFDDPLIWEVWDGTTWLAATDKPERENSLFIDQGHEVRLTAIEEVKNLYLYSAAAPGQKLNLQNFELHIFGALHGMEKDTVSADFIFRNRSSASGNWIYPETGKLVFKGDSRIVVDRSSWSADTQNSRFIVVFEPNPGQVLTVNSAFKANAFIIQSGTVIQTVNTDGLPACSTLSFNTNVMFNGSGPYGDLVIESGASLISECSAGNGRIIQRSNTVPAQLFEVQPGASFFVLGNDPALDAAQVLLNGNVYYQRNTGTQGFLRNTMPAATPIKAYHNLLFDNAAIKQLPDSIFLTGDFARLGGGNISESSTHLVFGGTGEQQIVGWDMEVESITVDKPSGALFTSRDIIAKRNFSMNSGLIEFGGNNLLVNTEGGGIFSYTSGRWSQLNQFGYQNLPAVLNSSNATFPFADTFQPGVRYVRMSGNSPGGNLNINFTEIPGSNWDPQFDDLDGTPILYQLNSYFTFSGLSPSTDDIELRISAENLIVVDVDDIRIVGNGVAAPGVNLSGVDADTLWARRQIPFGDLNGNTFTIGSFRELSILPVTWLESKAIWTGSHIHLTWSTAREKDNERFEIQMAEGKDLNFFTIAAVKSQGDSESPQFYEILLDRRPSMKPMFFRIKQVDHDGQFDYSRVFRLENQSAFDPIQIWPNPYHSGDLNIQIPSTLAGEPILYSIIDMKGVTKITQTPSWELVRESMQKMTPGVYVIEVHSGVMVSRIKLIKR